MGPLKCTNLSTLGSLGTTAELMSLCKEAKFGKEQIPNMILLYYSVFLPRLIYNAETWSSLTEAGSQCLQKARLHYLTRVLEIPEEGDHDVQFSESWRYQRRAIMTYNFLSPPNRFKPREFKEFSGGLLTYSLQPQ